MNRSRGHLSRAVDVRSSLVWVKVVVVGNCGVGKTSLIKRFCENKFSQSYQPTIGVDYGFKVHTAADKIELRTHLWDLSGASEYLDVRNELYVGADVVLVVFDMTDLSSFESLTHWLHEVKKFGPSDVQLCIVANKMDQKDKRVVSVGDANKWINARKLSFCETSCSNGEGIDALFSTQLELVVKRRKLKATNQSLINYAPI